MRPKIRSGGWLVPVLVSCVLFFVLVSSIATFRLDYVEVSHNLSQL